MIYQYIGSLNDKNAPSVHSLQCPAASFISPVQVSDLDQTWQVSQAIASRPLTVENGGGLIKSLSFCFSRHRDLHRLHRKQDCIQVDSSRNFPLFSDKRDRRDRKAKMNASQPFYTTVHITINEILSSTSIEIRIFMV